MSPKTVLENTETLLQAIAGSVAVKQARVRTLGDWCFFCGSGPESVLSACHCSFPESFQCHNQKVCAECRSAHSFIATHVREMIAAKRSDRSSSIRTRKFYQLHNACAAVEEQNPHVERRPPDHPIERNLERNLSFALSDATPWDDTRAEFRAAVLGAFSAVEFSKYKELSAALQKERDADLRHRVAAYFASCVR
jgi:hypothetical protein